MDAATEPRSRSRSPRRAQANDRAGQLLQVLGALTASVAVMEDQGNAECSVAVIIRVLVIPVLHSLIQAERAPQAFGHPPAAVEGAPRHIPVRVLLEHVPLLWSARTLEAFMRDQAGGQVADVAILTNLHSVSTGRALLLCPSEAAAQAMRNTLSTHNIGRRIQWYLLHED